jgi:hypothetical protein
MAKQFPKDLDNSRIDLYSACPQLFDYTYNFELNPGDSKWKANYSTFMIHEPVQAWWASGGEYKPDWQEQMAKWAPTPEEMMMDKFGNYTIVNANKAFNEHCEKAANRGDIERFEYLEHEVYRTADVGAEIKFGSKTDIILRDRATQEIVTYEIKASRWDYILMGLNFNRQLLGQMYTNDATLGIVEFFNLAAKKKDPMISFFELPLDWQTLEIWKDKVAFEINQILASYKADIWPTHTSSCKRFNQTCPFLDLCELGGSMSDEGKREAAKWPKHDSLKYLGNSET